MGEDVIWIYGDLLQPTELCDIYEISDCTSIDGSRYEVDRNTVGQYTGLKDKNGKEIYEGDIVKAKYHGATGTGYVEYDNDYCEYKIIVNTNKDYFNLWKSIDLEIIGNIYDNPELLEKEGINNE